MLGPSNNLMFFLTFFSALIKIANEKCGENDLRNPLDRYRFEMRTSEVVCIISGLSLYWTIIYALLL